MPDLDHSSVAVAMTQHSPADTVLTISVADDNPVQRSAMRAIVEDVVTGLGASVSFNMRVEDTSDMTSLVRSIDTGHADPSNHLFIVDVFMPADGSAEPSVNHGAFALYKTLKEWKRKHRPGGPVRLLMVTAYAADLEGREDYNALISEQAKLGALKWCEAIEKPRSIDPESDHATEPPTWRATMELAIQNFNESSWLGALAGLKAAAYLQGQGGRSLLGQMIAASDAETFPQVVVFIGSDERDLNEMAFAFRVLRGGPERATNDVSRPFRDDIHRLFGKSGVIGDAEAVDLIEIALPERKCASDPSSASDFLGAAFSWASQRQHRQVMLLCSDAIHERSVKHRPLAGLGVARIAVPSLLERKGDWKEIMESACGRRLTSGAWSWFSRSGVLTHEHIRRLKDLRSADSAQGRELNRAKLEALDLAAVARPNAIRLTNSQSRVLPQIFCKNALQPNIAKRTVETMFLVVLALATYRTRDCESGHLAVTTDEFAGAAADVIRAFRLREDAKFTRKRGRNRDFPSVVDCWTKPESLDDNWNALNGYSRQILKKLGQASHHGIVTTQGLKISGFEWFAGEDLAWMNWDVSQVIEFVEGSRTPE
jgi:hypothetical protein